jgi:hypothetical protein
MVGGYFRQNARSLGAALLLLGLTLVPFRVPNAPVWAAVLDAGHFALFGVVYLLLFVGLPVSDPGSWRHHWRLTLVCCVLAVSVEVIQPLVGRQGSLGDLVSGALGIVSALSGIRIWRARFGPGWRIGHAVLSLGAFGLLLLPAWAEWNAVNWRAQHFPLLADFESAAERLLWTAGSDTTLVHSTMHVSQGQQSLEVRSPAGKRGRMVYDAGMERWDLHENLRFSVYNPGEPFDLRLLILDDSRRADVAGRFTGRYSIENGWNELRVSIDAVRDAPREGTLDLRAIWHCVFVFGGPRLPEQHFFLDGVRLTGRRGAPECP